MYTSFWYNNPKILIEKKHLFEVQSLLKNMIWLEN